MNYKKDPIYRAFNKDLPDKQKTLAAALTEMESAPKAKSRISIYKVRRVVAACVIMFLVVLIPILIYSYTDGFQLKSNLVSESNDYKGAAPDAAKDQANYLEFDFSASDEFNESTNPNDGSIRSYLIYNEGIQESIVIFMYNGVIPQENTTINIDKLGVTGYYTAEPEDSLTHIDLYFKYGGINYRIVIKCTGEDRLPYFLDKIKI